MENIEKIEKKMKKLHLLNIGVLVLLIIGFLICIYISINFNIGEGALIGVEYLGGLFLFFSLFWIFMKWEEFLIEHKK